MKSIILLIAFLIGQTTTQEPKPSNVQLTVKVAKVKDYCHDSLKPEVYRLTLLLQFHIKNNTDKTLILQKQELGKITYWRRADSAQNLENASWGHFLWVSADSGDITDVGSEPDQKYKILQPGDSYEIETNFDLLSVTPITKNETFMQVSIPTWSGTNNQADVVAKKWVRIGSLWRRGLKSEPFSFLLGESIKMRTCPE